MSNNSQSNERLRLYIERIERLQEEAKGLADDIKDVKLEAKSVGYDVSIMMKVIKLRAMDKDKRDTEDALLETYRAEIGI